MERLIHEEHRKQKTETRKDGKVSEGVSGNITQTDTLNSILSLTSSKQTMEETQDCRR